MITGLPREERAPKDATLDTLTLEYQVDKSALAASDIWDSESNKIKLCQVVQLTLPDPAGGDDMIIKSFPRKMEIEIDFNANYEVLDLALINPAETSDPLSGSASVETYLIAYKCNPDFSENTDTHTVNTQAHICMRSSSPEIELDRVDTMVRKEMIRVHSKFLCDYNKHYISHHLCKSLCSDHVLKVYCPNWLAWHGCHCHWRHCCKPQHL